MDFSPIITKLQTTVTIKESIRTILESKGISVSCTFREFANLIYNIGFDESVEFVQGESDQVFINNSSILTTKEKIKFVESTKIWIENSIRARGVNTDSITFEQFFTLIEGITSETTRIPILSLLATETENFTDTEITVDGSLIEGDVYLYKITDMIPLQSKLDDSWKVLTDTITIEDGKFICVVLSDTARSIKGVGLIQAVVKQRGMAPKLIVTSTPGVKYNTTVLNITDIRSDREYYYKDYIGESFLDQEDIIVENYDLWDKESIVTFEYIRRILMIEVKDNKVYRFGIFDPVIKVVPEWYTRITILSVPGELIGYTTLSVFSEPLEGSKYYYKTGIDFDTELDLENFVSTGYIEWDGVSDIKLDNNIRIFLIEVSSDNKVLRGGSTVVYVKLKELEYLEINSTAGDKPNGTILTVIPEIESGNKYVYKESDQYIYPKYNDIINLYEYTIWNHDDELILKRGTRILLLEVSEDNKVKRAGYITVISKIPYIETLLVSSVVGEVTGFTSVIVSPELETGNKYMYVKGNTLVKYDQLVDNWNSWDGTSEIGWLTDGDIITVVECDNQYKAKKAGITTVKVRGLELIIFSLFSRKGKQGGCTIIDVYNSLDEGNKYKYNFVETSDEYPELYDDLSSWNDWNGSDEIPAVNGSIICIAEVDSTNQVYKAGIVEVRAKNPDPLLGELYIIVSDSSQVGHKIITVNPSLEDGYIYKYSFTDTLPKYNDDLSTWLNWDGKSLIDIDMNYVICITECTLDGFARKGGIGQI